MSSDPSAHDVFRFSLPVWTIVIDSEMHRGLPGAVSVMESPIYGLLLALFTDEDLASRFIEDAGPESRSPLRISDRRQLRALLEAFVLIGVSHVGIDCPPLANPRNETGRYPTIQQIIDIVGPG
jgi:hypothetical protein